MTTHPHPLDNQGGISENVKLFGQCCFEFRIQMTTGTKEFLFQFVLLLEHQKRRPEGNNVALYLILI